MAVAWKRISDLSRVQQQVEISADSSDLVRQLPVWAYEARPLRDECSDGISR
jgi:hypothetical protein